MKIVFKGKHLQKNEALKEHTVKKTEKFFHRLKGITKLEVELRTEMGRKDKDDEFIAELVVWAPGRIFKVSDQENDMYKAIDKSVKRMSEVLRREKEKNQTFVKRHLHHLRERFDFPTFVRSVNKRLFRQR